VQIAETHADGDNIRRRRFHCPSPRQGFQRTLKVVLSLER
jgi:hypothetical protein